ncbi:PREDICTED: coiled-coil domain-containing protein 103 [Eufriesea mexicana]|uniref:coiled-coil domain-containing protein 103 n=1 Tax=Eufriesea mexicana TaxID=516756 RepID=UPI00083BDE02|nr:PREDICTED: coiled-coil domain-containing protein 103 [Eufriesea mexicana]
MSKLRLPVNYKNMELELLEALRADRLYKLQNDAKLKAVEQKVPTYEDFRQLVNAAHLKPLEHADVKSKTKSIWNSVLHTDNSNMMMSLDKSKDQHSGDYLRSVAKNGNDLENEIPTTFAQFVQVWKTLKGYELKFNCLKLLRHTLREKIFCTEIPSTLFVQLIDICLQNLSITDNIVPIIDILHALAKCNRFYLTLDFMTQTEKEMSTRLFRNLLISVEYQNEALKDTIKTLALLYNIVIE